jgi:hypothetical protein
MGYIDNNSVNSSADSIVRSFNYLLKLSDIIIEKFVYFFNYYLLID